MVIRIVVVVAGVGKSQSTLGQSGVPDQSRGRVVGAVDVVRVEEHALVSVTGGGGHDAGRGGARWEHSSAGRNSSGRHLGGGWPWWPRVVRLLVLVDFVRDLGRRLGFGAGRGGRRDRRVGDSDSHNGQFDISDHGAFLNWVGDSTDGAQGAQHQRSLHGVFGF